jgi:predicted acylesterase/phospholipase RssA
MTQAHSTGRFGEAPSSAGNGDAGRQSIFDFGQIVMVLQGGGALGAYQAGVYQALHEAHVEPDWVIGTSIGTINASLIAGNSPERRLEKLDEFWNRVAYDPAVETSASLPGIAAPGRIG